MLKGIVFFFFKQKTAYEIYQCDWSSDVCSSDLRLEGQTKIYGTDIIVGESTMLGATSAAFFELDLLKVVGRGEAVRIYALLGDVSLAHSMEFTELKAQNAGMLEAYRTRKWGKAARHLKKCAELADAIFGDRLATYLELYRARIAHYRDNPPPKSWDGTAQALTK